MGGCIYVSSRMHIYTQVRTHVHTYVCCVCMYINICTLYSQADVFMHLTNYAINKHSDNFVRDDEEAGSKRCVPCVYVFAFPHSFCSHVRTHVYKIYFYHGNGIYI